MIFFIRWSISITNFFPPSFHSSSLNPPYILDHYIHHTCSTVFYWQGVVERQLIIQNKWYFNKCSKESFALSELNIHNRLTTDEPTDNVEISKPGLCSGSVYLAHVLSLNFNNIKDSLLSSYKFYCGEAAEYVDRVLSLGIN